MGNTPTYPIRSGVIAVGNTPANPAAEGGVPTAPIWWGGYMVGCYCNGQYADISDKVGRYCLSISLKYLRRGVFGSLDVDGEKT